MKHKWLSVAAANMLLANSISVASSIFWPLAVNGEVSGMEPNYLIRWIEFGIFSGSAILGLASLVALARQK